MVYSMKTLILIWSFMSVTFVLPPVSAEPVRDQLVHAAALNEQGKFREAIALVTPLLQSRNVNGDELIGAAWNIDGRALEGVGDRDAARRSYEKALRILRNVPAGKEYLAATYDNFGCLKAEMGQLQEALRLHTQAKKLYEAIGDHRGIALTLNNLALVALGQDRYSDARHLLTEAFAEETQVASPDFGDLAAFYNNQALERMHSHDPKGSLISINRAIQMWTEHEGPEYYLLASGYSLRGRLEFELGDRNASLGDFQHSLDILKKTGQANSRVYFLIETSYAEVLRHSGMKTDADRMKAEARSGLDASRQGMCPMCSVSVDSFR